DTRVPLRFEIFSENLVLDGAHNPSAMHELCGSLEDAFPGQKIIFLIGIMQDKDFEKIAEEIAASNLAGAVICTQSNSGYYLPLAELRACFKKHFDSSINVLEEPDMGKAFKLAKFLQDSSEAEELPIICICGSLDLVKDYRKNKSKTLRRKSDSNLR
ncbi:MAG: hypothetical protein HUJ51_04805, partial [Eggerthellaceae bacterium]|nr:hypothetical protein [Eggerthellaceae bacterium]